MSVELVLNRLKRCYPLLKLIKVLIKVNNGNTKAMCETCLKLTV